MSGIILLCRAGFESDCAAEIQDKATELGIYGYCQTQPDQAYVTYHCQAEEADHIARKLALKELVFAREMFVLLSAIKLAGVEDRASAVLEALLPHQESFALAGDLRVETPDTNEANQLSKFCRKFSVPLRQTLRKAELLSNKPLAKRPLLHVMFVNSAHALTGYSYSYNQTPHVGGILRLKMPKDGPSRSTLKLDEAFQVFVPEHERDKRIQAGMKAVDLGAAPGGWTYQLVRRDMMVQAVDNGPMADSLMETGQVQHIKEDGFKFRPKRKNINWLVCDMVEKPARVGELMTSWLLEGDCQEAIFNLKLPMRQRYAAVKEYLAQITEQLQTHGTKPFEIQAKHLYHDREEITVHLRWLPKS
ncbi:23S rRNA (cytidine2498-2'-O)-methyltransferase [Idiomarina aquatica]|uniref:Ribosomal RNA large subunit methyltransferase M n=1 Tax=Idiomarina aquatica TaxID=1327752 RepID=A0A4V3CMG1_9GAMM|nr:23S rRNA (cytidine(2498)-2'-O)-methyltransferase RlmM [Idiomarina aquatica]TDP28950.1 23S rRNA (cytidine2498-2'-O)-methyltransferase [Idiomarina aquatica]